jgi:hypothetical protein
MTKRITDEIDEQLPTRAKRAFLITRTTAEGALRRVTERAEDEQKERAARQLEYLESPATHVDLEVLASDEMWR